MTSTQNLKAVTQVLKRMTGLDGLRGVAVLAVVIYHADLGIVRGGFLGVDIFFVLSGFLITSILINEITGTGKVDRSAFYIRRIRRLMPALFLMLLVSVIAVGFWAHDAAYPVRRDLPWALTFVVNWSYIFFHQSYFINISRPPMLQHLWSLAIEEQFYVIWPMILVLLAKTKLNRVTLRYTIFAIATSGAIASAIWMHYLSVKNGYPTPNDPSRVYFGTDTHSMGLLLGCATAAVWNYAHLNPRLTPDRKTLMHLLGTISYVGIFIALFKISEFDAGLYKYGFFAVSLVTCIAVFLTTHPGLKFGQLLSARPLVWLGDRSYGIYIWHWPVFMLLRPGLDAPWSENINTLVRFVLVLGISDLSYKYVELPIRHGLIGKTYYRLKEVGIPKPQLFHLISTLTATVVFVTALVGMYRAPVANAASLGLGGITAVDLDPTGTPIAPTPQTTETVDPAASASPSDADADAPTANEIAYAKNSLAVFGDSVVLSGLASIQAVLGDIAVDAEIGRQPAETAKKIELRRAAGRLGNDVVIHMGTNGVITRQDLEPILQDLSDRRRVVVVNVKVPRQWMKASNAMINELAPLYPNVRVADWAATANGHRGYFGPDGVHLSKTGGDAFAALIKATIDAP